MAETSVTANSSGVAQRKFSDTAPNNDWQHHVLLKNETTVAVEDYDPKVHGKFIVETQDEYNDRLKRRHDGRPVATNLPQTTIANLATADSAEIHKAQTPVAPTPPAFGQGSVATQRVATKEPLPSEKDKKDDKNAAATAQQRGGKSTTR